MSTLWVSTSLSKSGYWRCQNLKQRQKISWSWTQPVIEFSIDYLIFLYRNFTCRLKRSFRQNLQSFTKLLRRIQILIQTASITSQLKCQIITKKPLLTPLKFTGYSLSDVLILASINPKYDDRLFIEIPVSYEKKLSTFCVHRIV